MADIEERGRHLIDTINREVWPPSDRSLKVFAGLLTTLSVALTAAATHPELVSEIQVEIEEVLDYLFMR
jgi:hypothetical protein